MRRFGRINPAPASVPIPKFIRILGKLQRTSEPTQLTSLQINERADDVVGFHHIVGLDF